MYGETSPKSPSTAEAPGLSPRVRGNHYDPNASYDTKGSIPACTGKPDRDRQPDLHEGVYPRVYGETHFQKPHQATWAGLSPRVRGNLPQPNPRASQSGSIPACTGKPYAETMPERRTTVYPRVYGETQKREADAIIRTGLSPRVRGNLSECSNLVAGPGSIPACTGKPFCCPSFLNHSRVYPRVYGETTRGLGRPPKARGLSPRVRGNRYLEYSEAVCEGSIPACTGKPLKGFVIFCSPFACGDPLEIPSVPTSQTEGLVVLHQVDAVGIHDVLRRFAKCTYTLFAHGRRVSPSHDYRALP